MDLSKDLNDQQIRAVEEGDGAVLVIAGAGSGKTRVLVHRIAHILRAGRASPDEIVAVTFTNKAASEMRARVAAILGGGESPGRVGTFHSLCLRMLRREALRLGYKEGFQVCDSDDSLKLIRQCLKESSLQDSAASPREFLRRISSAKNRGLSPEQVELEWPGEAGRDHAKLYESYQAGLSRMNAMDFDDLILNVLRLFSEHPDRLELWSGTCRHLLVDEYQDTNPPQYRLLRSLCSVHRNIFVVGDEDQAIYRFRGADIGNILSFKDDFPGAAVLKLTRNYRSVGSILKAANSLVRNNRQRMGKELWTTAGDGDRVRFSLLPGDREEAAFVVDRILDWRRAEALEDAAVLYRTNAQSRLIEEALVRARVPYQIFGSVRFYDRKEIRDLLAYLRLAVNPADDISFRRVLNVPSRGLGEAALMAVESASRGREVPLSEALERALQSGLFPARGRKAAEEFRDVLVRLREAAGRSSLADLLASLIREIGYEDYFRRTEPDAADGRMENVAQLVAAAAEADGAEGLQEFLDRVSLVSDVDSAAGSGGVNLMTLHTAKGLEFGAVFLVGLEEGLLPHARTFDEEDGVEEERRLCYVGMTRAARRLHLTAAATRRLYGEPAATKLSRFLDEIGEENMAADMTGAAQGPLPPRRRALARETDLGDEDLSRHPEDDEPGWFRVGADVQHDQFGVGKVMEVEPARGGQKLTIRFRGGRTRKLLTPYARLTVLRGPG